jgi:hypothetical protein
VNNLLVPSCCRQWVLAYLQPQDPAYFKAGNLPVAVYQYSYDFYRR